VGDFHRLAGPPRQGLMTAAAWTSLLLSVLFLVVYGGTNWITSLRSDVGTWYYEWELAIPFVPWFIIPYMSIDLFFVAGPFLCRDRQELRTLAWRIVFAILAAGVCFLLFPYRLMFDKPAEIDGWIGVIFREFCSLDQPYNLVPSLHITLRTILADLYGRHTRGLANAAVHVWFSLIGFSTVLTYQHHVVDVAGGFVLAAVCFYLIPGPSASVTHDKQKPEALARETTAGRRPAEKEKNHRVAMYYGMAAVAMLTLAAPTWPWGGGLLLWPGVALAILTVAYGGLGPGIYRKSGGKLPLSARLVLAPLFLGQHLSLLYYRRQCRPWDEVVPGLLIGRKLNNAEAGEAVRRGVTAVLDLTVEFSEASPFLAVKYHNLPILDLTAPTPEQLREAVQFITESLPLGTVYVHCKIGYSRSAAVVGAYLLASGKAATSTQAVALLRQVRPSIVVRPEAMDAICDFERTMHEMPVQH
jgi:membrane-associated phospholipid phosphatase